MIVQESFMYQEKIAAIQSAIPEFNFIQTSFAWATKSRIIDELIKNNSTVAFIEDVANVDMRLANGLIIELRQLELELICAGKVFPLFPFSKHTTDKPTACFTIRDTLPTLSVSRDNSMQYSIQREPRHKI